jgi:hypothetical protein
LERELMALLIEVTSISAAGKQLRKPVTIPRPKSSKSNRQADDRARAEGRDPAYGRAVSVLAQSSRSARAVSQ